MTTAKNFRMFGLPENGAAIIDYRYRGNRIVGRRGRIWRSPGAPLTRPGQPSYPPTNRQNKAPSRATRRSDHDVANAAFLFALCARCITAPVYALMPSF